MDLEGGTMRMLEAGEWGDVFFVVNHSGGKDSMRMLGKLRDEYPDVETAGVTSDTSFEHQKPVSAVEWVRLRCASLRNPAAAHVVRNPRKTHLEMVEQRGNSRLRNFGNALRT
jgi:hypothetical protein